MLNDIDNRMAVASCDPLPNGFHGVSDRSEKEKNTMASNKPKTKESTKKTPSASNSKPSVKESLERFKMEAANEVGVNLKQGYNGDITAKQAGSVGGQMVKNMNPVRTARFSRAIRTAAGHEVTVTYTYRITV